MRIAIVGAGGVGGYFGGLLADAGHEVIFIARGEHLAAIQTRGLEIRSVNGDFKVFPAQGTDDPQTIGVVDYVIVAVKHYQLDGVLGGLRSLVDEHTTVVPLLNGVDSHDRLVEVLDRENIVGGFCSLVSMVEKPGVIRQESALRRVVVGELNGEKTDRVEKIVQAWHDCGAESIHADDIHIAIWTKFLFIASFGGIGSLARANAGEILRGAETRSLLIKAMREIEALARAQGINLAPDVVDKAVALLESFEPTATSSMQRDVAAGRPFELEAFSGTITRQASLHGVEAPTHAAIYALLRPALLRALNTG